MREPVWQWHESRAVSAAGRAFIRDQLLTGAGLAKYLADAERSGKLAEAAADLNGSFAFVFGSWDGPDVIGVDRLRSIPLFYAPGQTGRITVARSGHTLRAGPIEPRAVDGATLLRCGYGLGSATLHPEVSDVPPGTILRFEAGREPTATRFQRHTRCHGGGVDLDYDELDRVSWAVGERLLRVLDGRQAIVPLSGGYDSRYVVSMLAEHGYRNVQLLTYGTRHGFEAKIASQVAEVFGYPWEFVDYTTGGLDAFVAGPTFARYWRTTGNYAAVPHVQEPFALEELRRRGLIDDEAIVVPGFCGDLLGGSFVPAAVRLGEVPDLLEGGLTSYVRSRLMTLQNPLSADEWAAVEASIRESIVGLEHPETIEDFVSELNSFVTDTRVARYVINGVRAYEQAGLDWYLPLWDTELTDAWYRAPLSALIGKALYDGYLLDRRFARDGVAMRQATGLESAPWFRRLRRRLPASTVRRLWKAREAVTRTRRFDVNGFGPIARWADAPLGDGRSYDGNVITALSRRYLYDVRTDFRSLDSIEVTQ